MMDERSTSPGATERPIAEADNAVGTGPAHLADARALTILTTEHWSLLTARSLVYNEAFSRAAMFLAFLTGTLVALGFVSQASGYTREFLALATVLLGFDLFIGLATLGRITAASGEEIRALQGINRLRHAYLEMVPSLDPYFSTSPYDDLPSVVSIYGGTPDDSSSLVGNLAHGLTTTPGMIGTITAAVGGAFAAALALLLGASTTIGLVAGLTAFVILTTLVSMAAYRQFQAVERKLEIRFPLPGTPGRPRA